MQLVVVFASFGEPLSNQMVVGGVKTLTDHLKFWRRERERERGGEKETRLQFFTYYPNQKHYLTFAPYITNIYFSKIKLFYALIFCSKILTTPKSPFPRGVIHYTINRLINLKHIISP